MFMHAVLSAVRHSPNIYKGFEVYLSMIVVG